MDKASKAFEEAIESMAKLAETVMKSTIGRAISKEEQIYEMALASCNPDFYKDKTCVECDYRRCCSLISTAEKLYTAGYRKASDVARETIAEAIKILKEKCLLTVRKDGTYCFEKEDVLFWLRTIPLKMEKKYTEGE